MTGLSKRRRTAQQILLRRALAKSVSGGQVIGESVLDPGGVVATPPLSRDPTLVSGMQQRSSSRAAMKLRRILASSPMRVFRERKTAGNQPGCELEARNSAHERGKLKPSEDSRTVSGHSLKTKEHSRGSSRSRYSTSNYPSTWQLNISKVKEDLKKNSQGSLEEIINCSILNRTPYDHQLNTPIKSDNSCQCTIKRRAKKRVKKSKAVSVAETQTVSENEARSYSEERKSPASGAFQKLKNRVNSGEDFRPDRMVTKTPSRSSANSRVYFQCKPNSSGPTYKNYGGYSPSETDMEMETDHQPKIPCQCDYLDQIEKVSKPPTNSDAKWGLKMPSNTEVQGYMARGTQENVPMRQRKNMDQDRWMQRSSNFQYENNKGKYDQSMSFKVKERMLKSQGRNCSEVSYDSLMETSKEFYARNKLPTPASLVSLEKFAPRNNNVESGEMLGECGKRIVYRDDVKAYGINSSNYNQNTTNGYPYYDHNKYSANDSDAPRKRHDTQAHCNQMDKRSYRQALGHSKRATRSFGTEDSFRGSFERANGRYADRHSPKCTVAVTQTSALFLGAPYEKDANYQKMPHYAAQHRQQVQGFKQEQPRSERSKTGARNRDVTSNSLTIESQEVVQSNSTELQKRERRRNQASFEQATADKTSFQSKPQKAEAKSLRLEQSNSLIIQAQEDQHRLVQSSSLEIALPKVAAPKNKKPTCTKKRKGSRCCSCCSRCSSRKRSVKKASPCEKTKSQVCENCQCKRSAAKNQDEMCKSMSKEQIPKRCVSHVEDCDVREILNILQKTVAGLEKQINSRKGIGKCENSKTADEGRRQTKVYQRKNVHMERKAFAQPVDAFQNQYLFKEDSSLLIHYNERPMNLGHNYAYSKRDAANCGNPSIIYQSNSSTYFAGTAVRNNAIYQNNTANGRTLQDSFNNASAAYEPFKTNITSRQTEYDYPMEICERKSQPYRTQTPCNEATNVATGSQAKGNCPMAAYKNQSINESFNRSCLNAQCSRISPQMQNCQQNFSAGQPKTDSHYSQASKTTSNAERQAPKEICNCPQYCAAAEHGQAGISFQERNNVCPETYTANGGNAVQEPLQICNNSTCPYALDYLKSWNSNRVDQTEIVPSCNPECVDMQMARENGIANNSEVCKPPEHCPCENSRGTVTFQVCDQSGVGEHTLNRDINYVDHTQTCDNPSCPVAGQLPSSWENPVYPRANSATYYSKESHQLEGNQVCGESFQKAGTAHNYEDFCGNPYCSAKNAIIYDEQGEGCQKSEDPPLVYRDEPEIYFCRNSHKDQTDKDLHQQTKRRNSDKSANVDYAENQVCSNHPRSQRTKHYFQTAGCSPNCPFNQREKRQGRITVVNRHRRDTMGQRHGIRNDDDYENSPEMQTHRQPKNVESSSKIFSSRRTQLEMYPQNEVEENFCTEDCPNSTNQEIRKNTGAIKCTNSKCPDNLKCKVSSSKDIHSPQYRNIYRTGNVEKSTEGRNCKNSECTDKKDISKDRNKYPTNATSCSSEKKCGKEFCKSAKEINRSRNKSGYADSKSHQISSARRSSQSEKKTKVAGKTPFPEYEFAGHSGLYAENCYDWQQYVHIPHNQNAYNFQVCENPKCSERFGEPVLNCGEIEYMKKVSCNAHCPNNQGINRVPNEYEATTNNPCKVTSQKQRAYSERKANCPREDKDTEIQCKQDTALNTKSCSHRLHRRQDNNIEVCNNPKFPEKTHSNCHCPKRKGIYCTNERMLVDREKDQCDDVSYDSEGCFEDCPYRHRVLFTDLRKCKINSKNRGRQRSGKSDDYNNDQIATRICNSCKMFVPLKKERQVLHKHCNLPKAEAKDVHESKEIAVCITPSIPAPVFAENRRNSLVTDPILNSYDRHILRDFEKFKENEEKKSRKCAQECPFLRIIEDKPLPMKSSSACLCATESQNHEPSWNCKSDKLMKSGNDTKRKQSKSSIFSCCLKPKNDDEQETEMGNEKALPKSSAFSCFIKKNKNPNENPKPKEKTSSKSSFNYNKKNTTPTKKQKEEESRGLACFQRIEKPQEKFNQREKKSPPSTKSRGFLCFKTNNKRPQDENIEGKSPRETNEKPANAGNDKNIIEYSSKKSSKRSGFFTWCRKPQRPKVYDRKMEEVPAGTDCTCSNHPAYQYKEVSVPKSEDPFRCPCAPDEIDDGEVRVLYDSSFRFQKESCSLAEVPNHNDPQKPGQATAEIKEQEVSYCPCASANGFYKIVR
ncbi:uncharacterized protein LOC6547461 [Drosophila erecta]|uniref:Uncharacterized protein n=1 Tax=Drosophila erecta TaxID=7220 RepID=B3NN90_DROER|nr:uncharacterized protein LOC6547461 [Drosophila erecta]EDV56610.2 uncharacterized protein Dere_GG20133 [Drosophila erecta]